MRPAAYTRWMLWLGIALLLLALVLRIVSVRMRRTTGQVTASAPSAPTPRVSDLDAETRAEIDALLDNENRIKAIKRLRGAVPGLDLAEAKAQIDAWGETALHADSTPTGDASSDDAFSTESLERIDALIADEQLISAIKFVRESTGWGLREAKLWVEARAGR